MNLDREIASQDQATDARIVRLALIAILLGVGLTIWHGVVIAGKTADAQASEERRDEAIGLIDSISQMDRREDARVVAPDGFLAYPYIRKVANEAGFSTRMNFDPLGNTEFGDSGISRAELEIRIESPLRLEDLVVFLLSLASSEIPIRCRRIELSSFRDSGPNARSAATAIEQWRVERLIVSFLVSDEQAER